MADTQTPTCHRVRLPSDVEGDITVYKNGAEVREGVDFTVEDGWLRFAEPLYCGRKTGLLGRMQMTIVGIGVYEKVDKIDVHVTRPDGRFEIFPDLEATPES
jgi:hypothetical protein